MSTFDDEAAPEAVYDNPATGESFTESHAADAGWKVTHEGVDAKTEGVTLNATHFFAEKYVSPPGRPGGFVQLIGHTFEGLLAAIQQYEQQFAHNDEGTVLLPAEGVDFADVDASDESTIQKVPESVVAAVRANDVLVVPSDPEDPESEPKRLTLLAGQEVDESVLSEPFNEPTQTIADVQAGHSAAIDKALELRDNADSADEADGADAAQAASQADADKQQAVFDNESPASEVVQPAPGEATDASDSEQQSQVPDSEAASSDAVQTNSTDEFPKSNETAPVVVGPDTDAQAPALAPNAPDETTAAEKLGVVEPEQA